VGHRDRAARLLLAAAVLLSGCAKQNARETAAAGADGRQVVGIDAVNDAFRPWAVQARVGQPLVVRLHNNGVTAHTFTIYDIDMDVVLQPGQRRTVTIHPPGGSVSWRFLCRFHDAGGMHGSLTFGNPPPSPLGPP
jgi:plastocyanin